MAIGKQPVIRDLHASIQGFVGPQAGKRSKGTRCVAGKIIRSFCPTYFCPLLERRVTLPGSEEAHTTLASALVATNAGIHLTQDTLNDLAGHIGQTEITTLETESQLPMIQTQLMQDRCLQIMHVAFVLDDG